MTKNQKKGPRDVRRVSWVIGKFLFFHITNSNYVYRSYDIERRQTRDCNGDGSKFFFFSFFSLLLTTFRFTDSTY